MTLRRDIITPIISMKIAVLREVMKHNLVGRYRKVGDNYCHHPQVKNVGAV
jgi:hypothetical protein